MTVLRRLLGFILLGLIYWFIVTSPSVGEPEDYGYFDNEPDAEWRLYEIAY